MRALMPDGRWLNISGNDAGFLGPWAFLFWVRGAHGSFRAHTGARGSAEILVVNSGRTEQTKVREASMRGARLVSLEDSGHGGTTFVWQGAFHEVSTYIRGTNVAFETFVSRLAQLDLVDSREGVLIRAGRGTGVTIDYGLGANFVPEVCSIGVRPADRVLAPDSIGRAVPGGRMWREDLTDEAGRMTRRMVTIINESTVTSLAPFDPADPRLRTLAESIIAKVE